MANFRDPDMYCPKGHLIPRNGEYLIPGEKGSRALKTPLLGCAKCVIEASKDMPQEPRKVSALSRARNPHEDQERFDVGAIFID